MFKIKNYKKTILQTLKTNNCVLTKPLPYPKILKAGL